MAKKNRGPKPGPPARPRPRAPVARLGSNPPSGRSNADEHFHELVGSNGLWIYLPPQTPLVGLGGYDRLRADVASRGCTIDVALDAPVDLGMEYVQLKIASRLEPLIPDDVLKLAHRWAHNHDFLHSFFKPTSPGRANAPGALE
jgi:hypothetical protein